MKKTLLFASLFFVAIAALGQSKHGKTSAFKNYKGLVMAGYQGWFNAQGDGGNRGWNHYVSRGKFEPGFTNIDVWPDVSEYPKTYKTPFKLADGSDAYVYSSHDESSTEVHFRWMKEYGVDGVFVQRFIGDVQGTRGREHNNTVLGNALKYADKYGRAISLMYDLSGMRAGGDSLVIKDFKKLIDSMKLTSRGNKQTWLYHNGKPLIAVWGVGFNDNRRYGLAEAERIIDFLKNDPVYGGCSVLLGVPTYWRDFGNDTEKDPQLHDLLKKVDIIHPWLVGRFNEASYPKFQSRIAEDIAWCKANKLDYVPTVFPGFSWHNMNPKATQDQIPRNRGSFYWKQINGAINGGAEMIYVAMFDEVDEGTAILKTSKNPPVGLSNFVKIEDDIPNDYYLYLTGQAAKTLRKQIPMRDTPPPPIKK
ncbi:glycoside hydrolase family 71/99-like protein [Mucilaginibacter myungsuensis]|uniref:Xylosidase n=1 Tax=Mucilaginibacter myungsuensis TaxID=649104 RepID=A0A929KUB2_9SPHI|nr:glycoside hydrolase family 71/99-like protein [Mucilaginibacter myungsuensis]MBE9661706.1 xylosidase [Mucilaginibacter myungsuensis]MDN3597849.1 glycoside hydrolase family 71/99-like protein [Mucilaginibacter myungsuensis]